MKRIWGLLGILIIWELLTRCLGSPLIVGPLIVLPELWYMLINGEILPHLGASLLNVILGFGLATAIGIIFGIAVHESVWARQILMPVIDAMRPIAALTLFPLIIVLLGLGISSKVIVIFWTAWPAILLNTDEGLEEVDCYVIEAASLDGATRRQVLRYIKLPLALPMILTGLRIGLSGGWISLVSAEMLGAHKGLGYSILAYSQTFRFAKMYAVVILIALTGLAMNLFLNLIQRLYFWEELQYVSPFIRFNDRANSFGLDTFRLHDASRSAYVGDENA